MVVAALLRFDHLWDRGLIFWDEAKFALEGIRLEQALRMVSGLASHPGDGKAVGTAKPTHALLLGLAYVLFGIHDYSGLYLDAACSLVAVAATYLIGRAWFSPRVALIAALMLAVSCYEIVYARSDLSESDACLAFLAAIVLWNARVSNRWLEQPSGRVRWILAVGAVMSICFTINYRAIVYIAVLIGCDLGARLLDSRYREMCLAALWWLLGLASLPAAWALAGAVAGSRGLTLFRDEFTGGSRPYLSQIVYQLHQGKQSVVHFEPGIYVQWFAARETPVMLVPVVVGALVLFARRDRRTAVVAALAFIPYAIYTFAPFVVPRNLEMSLPFVFLIAAVGVDTLLDRLPAMGSLAVGVAILLLLITDAGLSFELTGVRSGFAQAAAYVQAHGGRAATATEISVFYLERTGPTCRAPALALHLRGLRAQIAHGYSFAILEPHQQTSVSDYIEQHDPLIMRVPALGLGSLPDDLISSENSGPPTSHRGSEYVAVYRLAAGPVARTAQPLTCSRDLDI